MFKNLKINVVLWGTALFIVILMSINATLSYSNIVNTERLIEEKRTEILPHAFNFLNLKLNVIQVQQWLTDISATRAQEGYDDGFVEAKKYFDEANTLLDHIISEHQKYNEPEMVKELQEFKSNFADYYAIGVEMANAYIKEGTLEGNKMMSKLDPFAERLGDQLEIWVTDHRKENAEAANKIVEHVEDIKRDLLISIFVLIFIILLSFSGISSVISSIKVIHTYLKRLATLDFRDEIHLDGKNEISEIAHSLNDVLREVKKIISIIAQTSNENVAISEELTRTSSVVGTNIKKSTDVVSKTTEKTISMQKEIELYVQEAKKK
jgi:methyl-accepting chemotaxis protein